MSARAQELAEKLLGLEATRAPLPVEGQRFQGMGSNVKAFYQKNKKVLIVGTIAIVGAVVIYAGVKAYQDKKK